MQKIEVARVSDVLGDFGFYCSFHVELCQINEGGEVSYLVMGNPFSLSRCLYWVPVRVFSHAEDALAFYWNARHLLSSSCWVLDTENDCILDPEGIRFALTGEVLP